MYELIQVSENNYYIQSPAKIGLIKLNDTEVILIDSGNDKDAGKNVCTGTYRCHGSSIRTCTIQSGQSK